MGSETGGFCHGSLSGSILTTLSLTSAELLGTTSTGSNTYSLHTRPGWPGSSNHGPSSPLNCSPGEDLTCKHFNQFIWTRTNLPFITLSSGYSRLSKAYTL